MSYRFQKQRFCHLALTARDRKRGQFWVNLARPHLSPDRAPAAQPAPC